MSDRNHPSGSRKQKNGKTIKIGKKKIKSSGRNRYDQLQRIRISRLLLQLLGKSLKNNLEEKTDVEENRACGTCGVCGWIFGRDGRYYNMDD
jgi:hypothetical protein